MSIAPAMEASDMNIIYKGICEQCKAEVIIILRQVRTLENLRGQFKRTCMMCERSEVMLEMQGFRGDTA
jgi:predicted DCC family thiol-disulfide oxidoreductase YuxK